MANDSRTSDVAVFIDFENVYVSVRDKLDANPNFESIMDRCEDLGRVVIARAYADWYRYPRVTSALYANGIEPMYVPTYYYDRDLGRTGRAIKNSVDMNLCVDAMKTLFTNPNIAKFVLATGDRDFIPLVNTIRQQGKEVIIIGVGGAASSHLAQSADEFIFYESLIGKKPSQLVADQPRARMPEKGRETDTEEAEEAAPPARPSGRQGRPPRPPAAEVATPEPAAEPLADAGEPDVYDVLIRAIHLARERGYVCSFGSLKLLMKELMGGEFRENRYKDLSGKPFAKFKDFVLDAERRGKVQVFTNGTVNEVFLPGEDPYKLSQFALDLKEEPAPPTEAGPEPRIDGRPLSGRPRRRRRPRGGARATEAAPPAEEFTDLDQVSEVEPIDLPALDLSELDVEPAIPDSRFDDLLAQVIQNGYAGEMLEPEPAPAGEAPEPAPVEEAPPPILAVVFTEDDWAVLRAVLEASGRPLSFVQLHDALRDARNRAAIHRSNEELRTLIKQAINSGMLQRSGKGSRAVYRLAAPAAEADAPDQPALVEAEPAEAPGVPVEVLDTPVEPLDVPVDVPPLIAHPGPDVVADDLLAAPAEEEVAAPARRSRSRRRKPAPAAEPVIEPDDAVQQAAPAAETPTPAPASRSRRRKAAPPAEAAPAPVAEAVPAAEAAPKRRPRRTPAASETPGSE
jgi:uncharacterized protein (TIGR00288 family)